jgi:hypothetical protein
VSRRLRFPLLAIVPIAALSLCASASAVVTVGSPLAGPFTQGACDATGGCTIADLALVAPGPPVASPVTGTIIRWRVVGATPVPGYAIRALGRGAGAMFTGAGTSTPVTPFGGGVETFGADLPIKAGEYVGINVPEGGGIDGISPGGQYAALVPELADGGSANALEESGEIAFNADVLGPPTVSAISPSTGTTAGGTSVVIAGSEFAEVKGVSFGGAAATSYAVDSEGQITAVAPATSSAGAIDVTVTTIAGTTSAGGGADRFTYSAPAAPTATPIVAPARQCVVPKLTGRKLKLAKKKIRFAHCRLGLVSRRHGVNAKTGKVVREVPKAGKVAAAGTKVSLKLG